MPPPRRCARAATRSSSLLLLGPELDHEVAVECLGDPKQRVDPGRPPAVLEARDRGLRRPGQVRELLLREAELRAALGHSVGDLSEEPAVLRAGDAPAEAFERLGCVPAVLISHVCYNSIRAM